MKILIIEDEKPSAEALKEFLLERGDQVEVAENGARGLERFRQGGFDVVLLDWKLPDMDGEDVFKQIREINPLSLVIFITAYAMVDKAVKVLKEGAFYYMTKPIELDQLDHLLKEAEEKLNLRREVEVLRETLGDKYTFENFVARSRRMQEVLSLAVRAARSTASILITGESGTGKEKLARIIHGASPRANGPFIAVNLAAIPETLIESELFGAEKGAYTGADRARPGKFELASGGTLFLDEISEIPPAVQVKLLRVLQEREVQRLGSSRSKKVDVRIISATNRNLQELVERGEFRSDLYYRLNVIEIKLPPLRKRREEIPALVEVFIKKYSAYNGKEIKGITREALEALMKYRFPGNIRELENIIERAVVLSRGEYIGLEDLPPHILREKRKRGGGLQERLREEEIRIIKEALEESGWNQSEAARRLGISESTLRYRMKILGLQKP